MVKTVNFPKILCTVRALYTYSSTESSSLSFEEGDSIDVLNQLDSGWWDGWCKGNRGWFPSNYVEVISQSNSNSSININNYKQQQQTKKHTETAGFPGCSLNSVDTLTSRSAKNSTEFAFTSNTATTAREKNNTNNRKSFQSSIRNSIRTSAVANELDEENDDEHTPPLPEGWTMHIATDGRTKFYFNQRTGGLRYTHPALLESENEEDDSCCSVEQDKCDDESKLRIDTNEFGSRATAKQHGKNYSSCCNSIKCQCEPTALGERCKHTTYCNEAQKANCSSKADDAMCTRKTESIKGKATTMNGFYGSNRMNNSPNAHNKMLFEENIPRDWRTIATNIARSVQDLQRAIINTENANEFRTETYAVVDAVRYMLYSSRSLDKDAIHLQDQEVKESLRLVLSTLAKLILSAKAVNDINTDNMDNNKVKRDAADVLTATRKFVTICQTKNVQIQQIEPILKVNDSEFVAAIAPHGNNNGAIANKRDSGTIINANSIRAKHPLNQDLVVSLQTHAKQIVGSTDALCKATTFLCHSKEEQQGQFHDGNSILSTHPSSGGQSLILEQKSRSNFILLFQNLTSQIGNYFTILEDIDISNVDVSQLHSLPDYYCNKQRLYNAVGLLFSAIQTLTDTKKDLATAVASVEHNIANVENTIEMIFSTVVQMVAERKVWLMRTEDGGMSTNSVYNKDGTDTCDNSTITPNNTSFNEVTSIASSPHNGPHYLSIRSPSKEAPLPQQVSINNSAQQNESLQKQTSIKLPRSINSSNKRTIINRQLSNNNVMTNGASDNAQATARSQFWFLGYDYDENDIEFTQDKNIKGGTLEVLVERLTLHDYIDMSFIANFLLTYRSFCTTEEFVALLQERYNLAPPESLTPDELEIWTDKKQKLVRLRVFNVMKNWLENYYNDEDEFILDKLQFFANTVICDSSSFSAEQLNRLIRKRRELEENTGGLKKLIPNALYGPMPIMPKNLQHIHLLDTDPLEMARQLTILDFKLYSSIQPIECLGKAWCKDGSTAVNVKQSIDYCNRLTAWVTGTILSNKEAKKRVVLLKYWAQVANRCLQMNNFNTCMAVLSAFDNSAVARLKKTWELVSGRTNQGLAHIRKIMGSNKNFQEYREMIHSVNPPCIPFLGIYLQDLTFIEDGNPDMLKKSNNLINFAKRQKAAEVIREIKQFQSPPYNFQYVPEIQVYIKMQLETSKDIDFLYERSLELEPRNNNPMTVSDHAA